MPVYGFILIFKAFEAESLSTPLCFDVNYEFSKVFFIIYEDVLRMWRKVEVDTLYSDYTTVVHNE